MSTRTEVKQLGEYLADRTGHVYGLTTYSPGDGVTRYRIGRGYPVDTPHLAPGYLHDYFGDYSVCTALGAAEALVMLRAFHAGLDAKREV